MVFVKYGPIYDNFKFAEDVPRKRERSIRFDNVN